MSISPAANRQPPTANLLRLLIQQSNCFVVVERGAAFMDGYNSMVISLRQYRAQEVKGGLDKGGQLPIASGLLIILFCY